jgi:hypothetical protein
MTRRHRRRSRRPSRRRRRARGSALSPPHAARPNDTLSLRHNKKIFPHQVALEHPVRYHIIAPVHFRGSHGRDNFLKIPIPAITPYRMFFCEVPCEVIVRLVSWL